jgi:hypothetical protein
MKHTIIIAALLFTACKKECNDKCGNVVDNRLGVDINGYYWEIDYVTECGDTLTLVTRNVNIGASYQVGEQYCEN